MRSSASGVRSSWLASATKRRSCSTAACRRSSISFSVCASRDTSSPRRRHGQPARLSRMHGLGAFPQELHRSQGAGRERVPAERSGEQGEGKEDQELVAQVVERLVARLERTSEHRDAVPARRGLNEDPPLAAPLRKLLVEPDSPTGERFGDDAASNEGRQLTRLRVAQLPVRPIELRERRAAPGVGVDGRRCGSPPAPARRAPDRRLRAARWPRAGRRRGRPRRARWPSRPRSPG